VARPGADALRAVGSRDRAQAVVAAVFALRGSSMPWHAAEPWLPVYGTLIDIGCLTLLWRLTRREGIGLLDLVGLDRTRIIRDVSLGLALIPMSLVFIFGGTYLAGWAVYGAPAPPYFLGGLPLPAGVYGVLVWPFVWGLSEQMTFNGYLLSRFQVLFRSTSAAIVVVGFVWSLQHAFMPLTFDGWPECPVGSWRGKVRGSAKPPREGAAVMRATASSRVAVIDRVWASLVTTSTRCTDGDGAASTTRIPARARRSCRSSSTLRPAAASSRTFTSRHEHRRPLCRTWSNFSRAHRGCHPCRDGGRTLRFGGRAMATSQQRGAGLGHAFRYPLSMCVRRPPGRG